MKLLTNKPVIVLISLLILGSVWYLFLPKSSAAPASETKELAVSRGTLQIDLQADGKSDLSILKLRFGISGVLHNLPVKLGEKVKSGQIIAQLDTRDTEFELANAKANYLAAVAKLGNTQSQNRGQSLAELNKLNNARTQYEKDQREYETMLQAADAFSKAELESKKMALASSQGNYAVAQQSYASVSNNSTKLEEATIAQAKATVDKAQKNLEGTMLKAPVDGVVLGINYKVGETVSANNDFMVISDGQGIVVKAQVLEMDIKDVFQGQAVEMEFEAIPSTVFTGTVTYIDSLPVNDPNGVVAYNVDISLKKPNETIKSGSSCVVTFIVEQKKDVLIIPNAAVKVINGKQTVEVKDKQGNLSAKPIKTGFTDGTNVEVAQGLQAGEVVLVPKQAGNGK